MYHNYSLSPCPTCGRCPTCGTYMSSQTWFTVAGTAQQTKDWVDKAVADSQTVPSDLIK